MTEPCVGSFFVENNNGGRMVNVISSVSVFGNNGFGDFLLWLLLRLNELMKNKFISSSWLHRSLAKQ